MVYNFALPPLVLHAFHAGSCERLARWAEAPRLGHRDLLQRPRLHDGVGCSRPGILSAERSRASWIGARARRLVSIATPVAARRAHTS
jgi:sucrose phosphorylase